MLKGNQVESDKYFSIYMFTIIGGLAAVLAASIQAGYTTLPSPLVFIEHVAMSLTVRAGYKSLGWDWGPWTFGLRKRTESVVATAAEVADLGSNDEIAAA